MKLPRVSKKWILPSVLVVATVICAVFAWYWCYGLMVVSSPFLAAGAVYTLGVTLKRPRIKVAAAVLGVFGGVIAIGPFLVPLWIPRPPVETVLGTLALLMAIGGGVLALGRPRVGGILMLLASIIEWSGFGADLLSNTLFLIPAGALALASDKKRPAAIYVAMTLGIIGGLAAGVSALDASTEAIRELPFWTWVPLFPSMGVLGGILVLEKPKVAARLMLISAIIGLFGYFASGGADEFGLVFAGVACFLLIIAGTIAFIASDKKRPAAIYVAMTLGIIGGLSAGMSALYALEVLLLWTLGIGELPCWTWVLLFPSMGILGILVLILVPEKPKVAARLMLISAIIGPVGLYAVGRVVEVGFDDVGFVYAFVFAGIACFLLIIASTIAFIKK